MRTLFISAIVVSFCLNLGIGQTRITNSFYNKYKQYEDVTNVSVPGWLISLGASIGAKFVEDDEERLALDVAKKIEKVNIIVMENENVVPDADREKFIRDLKRFDHFEPFISVRDKDTKVNFMVRESNDIIKNLIIIVSEEKQFVMVSVKANITLEQLNELIKQTTKEMDIEDNPANILRV